MIETLFSRYDKQLSIKHNLDGSYTILRKSPFKHKFHELFTIRNCVVGSGRWIIKKLFEMDAQKHNFIPNYIKQHKRQPLKRQSAMHKDIAQFIIKNEQIII